MTGAGFKKFLAFGSGIGVTIEGARGAESLRVTAVRVRPTGARVMKQFLIEQFHERPAAEWGTAYEAFVNKLGMKHVPAVVLLPRHDVILRQVALPGVSDADLNAAIAFQLEGLHPWGDLDDSAVVASWARLGESDTVVVAIARREVVDRYITTFAEAGIKLAGFTCSAAAIYSGLRLFGNEPASEILACEANGRELEVYGESPARRMLSATFPLSMVEAELDEAEFLEDENAATEPVQSEQIQREMDRAMSMAAAELRIQNLPTVRSLKGLLGVDHALSYAAALASACPHLSLALNLLPEDQRQTGSPYRWVPTAVLGAAVLLIAIGLELYPSYQNGRVLAALNQEAARIQPAATKSGQLDHLIDDARARTLLLDKLRGRSKADMDTLAELTRLLPPPAWLRVLEMNELTVTVTGQTKDAADPLLKVLDESPLFEASEFNSPPTRVDDGESFRIRTKRSTVPGKVQNAAAAAPPAGNVAAAPVAPGNAAVPVQAGVR
jgi:Tfp pilus assembly protein PilN